VAQELSAVTGACFMTWKDLYQRLGGMDETAFPVAFNDVDYCLRAQDAGYRVIFTPHAQLYHHESATRGRDASAARAAMEARDAKEVRQRWGERLWHDPYYNPNLSYERPDFSLSTAPRVRKPWRR
jgi:GT2 family glycosyltransferase